MVSVTIIGVALLIYASFWLWYIGFSRTINPELVDQVMDTVSASNSALTTDTHRKNFKHFLENDDGKDFVMVNLLRLKRPTAESRKNLGIYSKVFLGSLLKRAGHPVAQAQAAAGKVEKVVMLKKIIVTLSLAIVTAASLLAPVLATTEDTHYSLGAGDLIRISVFEEEDLSFDKLLVGDRGIISYPFLDEIKVQGNTTKQLEQQIIAGLHHDYLIDPKVTVSIIEYRNFYVNGEVENSGGFPFKPGLNVRKAISLAGGFTDRASKRNIFIVHDDDDGKTPNRVTLNSSVKPGDSITIEQSFF
jgi:polysaccharide export outer membrane protein